MVPFHEQVFHLLMTLEVDLRDSAGRHGSHQEWRRTVDQRKDAAGSQPLFLMTLLARLADQARGRHWPDPLYVHSEHFKRSNATILTSLQGLQVKVRGEHALTSHRDCLSSAFLEPCKPVPIQRQLKLVSSWNMMRDHRNLQTLLNILQGLLNVGNSLTQCLTPLTCVSAYVHAKAPVASVAFPVGCRGTPQSWAWATLARFLLISLVGCRA